MENPDKNSVLSKDDIKIITLYVAVGLGASMAKLATSSKDDQSAIITSLLVGAVDIVAELDQPTLLDLAETARKAILVKTDQEYLDSPSSENSYYSKQLIYEPK